MGSIYCLFSSNDGIPRYVGQTARDPERRWKEHIARALDKEEDGPLCDWIRDVLRSGDLVQFWVLQEDVAPVELGTFETYWSSQFSDLLNCNVACPAEATELGKSITAAVAEALRNQRRRRSG